MSNLETHTGWINFAQGAHRRIIADGQQMMLVKVHFDAGAVVAEHHHVHEQISYLVSGRVRFTVAGKDREMTAGESIVLPSDVPHSVVAIDESVVLDMFSPPREDFRA